MIVVRLLALTEMHEKATSAERLVSAVDRWKEVTAPTAAAAARVRDASDAAADVVDERATKKRRL